MRSWKRGPQAAGFKRRPRGLYPSDGNKVVSISPPKEHALFAEEIARARGCSATQVWVDAMELYREEYLRRLHEVEKEERKRFLEEKRDYTRSKFGVAPRPVAGEPPVDL